MKSINAKNEVRSRHKPTLRRPALPTANASIEIKTPTRQWRVAKVAKRFLTRKPNLITHTATDASIENLEPKRRDREGRPTAKLPVSDRTFNPWAGPGNPYRRHRCI